MEDFGILIMILIWLVISFLRKKPKDAKSKGKPRPATQQEPQQETDFEEMLEEFLGGGKKKEKQQEPVEVEEPERKHETAAERHYREKEEELHRKEGTEKEYEEFVGVEEDFEFSSEGKIETIEDLIKSHKDKEPVLEVEEVDGDQGEGIRDDLPDFDLRKAVIYSEIYNRKYS